MYNLEHKGFMEGLETQVITQCQSMAMLFELNKSAELLVVLAKRELQIEKCLME